MKAVAKYIYKPKYLEKTFTAAAFFNHKNLNI